MAVGPGKGLREKVVNLENLNGLLIACDYRRWLWRVSVGREPYKGVFMFDRGQILSESPLGVPADHQKLNRLKLLRNMEGERPR
jgi:hypothetical protein